MKSFSLREGVPGFLAAGIAAGIKKNGDRDLGLLLSEKPCVAAGVFTNNRVKAAPVLVCKKRLQKGIAQAVLVNSGNANACTGKDGLNSALLTCSEAAHGLGIPEHLVLPCSTGVIGVPLPAVSINKALPRLIKSASPEGIADFSEAVMTTDTFPKVVTRSAVINGDLIKVCGIAKGSGMIMPQMATMLAFILTNAAIKKDLLTTLLKKTAEETFNRISVDGETSTNDTVLLLASGVAGRLIQRKNSAEYKKFALVLQEVMRELALLIVRDGEGATKLISIRVLHAKSLRDAQNAAFRVANSPLFKTACFGGDYNWGRIMAALGNSGAAFEAEKVEITINNLLAVKNGQEVAKNHLRLKNAFKNKRLDISINLHNGRQTCEVFTCDLSYDYVKINAAYTT
jgi:glutamate N-acetyltransferase/amino-acid N-acetyltransferase